MHSEFNRMENRRARAKRSKVSSKLALIGAALTATSAMAASQTWTGLGGDGLWSNGANWSGGAAPGVINPAVNGLSNDVATFNGPVLSLIHISEPTRLLSI